MGNSVRLIKTKGLQFLLERAKKLAFHIDGEPPRNAADLRKLDILLRDHESASRYANGRYPITPEHARNICSRLKITPEEWDSITSPTDPDSEGGEFQPVEPFPSEFFKKLRVSGLQSVVAFFPRRARAMDIQEFCVRPQVLADKERDSLPEYRELWGNERNAVEHKAKGELLGNWLQRSAFRAVLFGNAGQGKSTALWLYVAELCAGLARKESSRAGKTDALEIPAPLILPLGKLADVGGQRLQNVALDYMISLVGPSEPEGVRAWYQQQIQNEQYVLLLDGFDELPAPLAAWLRKELDQANPGRLIMTSRFHAYPQSVLPHFEVLRLLPLEPANIKEFGKRFFSVHPSGGQFQEELETWTDRSPLVRQLVRTPFFLGAMCELKAADAAFPLPTTRADLVHAVLHWRLIQGDVKRNILTRRVLRNESKLNLLSQVAWHFQSAQPQAMPEVELLKALDQHKPVVVESPFATAEDALSEFLEDRVIVGLSGGPSRTHIFLLRSFREYSVARHIAAKIEAGPPSKLGDPNVLRGRTSEWGVAGATFKPMNQTSWWEIWPLIAGCAKGNDALMEALVAEWRTAEDVGSSRCFLLARTLAEFFESNRDLPRLTQKWSDLAGQVVQELLELPLDDILRNEKLWEEVLVNLPARFVAPKLIAAITAFESDRVRLLDQADEVAATATLRLAVNFISILGKVGGAESRRFLRMIIKNFEPQGKVENAVIALGRLADAAFCREAIGWLENHLLASQEKPRQKKEEIKRWQEIRTGYLDCLAASENPGCLEAFANIIQTLTRRLIEQDRSLADASFQDTRRVLWRGDVQDFAFILRSCHGMREGVYAAFLDAIQFLYEVEARGAISSVWNSDLNWLVEIKMRDILRTRDYKMGSKAVDLLKFMHSHSALLDICYAVADFGNDAMRNRLAQLARQPAKNAWLALCAALGLLPYCNEADFKKFCSLPVSSADANVNTVSRAMDRCQKRRSKSSDKFLRGLIATSPNEKIRKLLSDSSQAELSVDELLCLFDETERFHIKLNVARELVRREGGNTPDAIIAFVISSVREDSKENYSGYKESVLKCLQELDREDVRLLYSTILRDEGWPKWVKVSVLEAADNMRRLYGWRLLRTGNWEAP